MIQLHGLSVGLLGDGSSSGGILQQCADLVHPLIRPSGEQGMPARFDQLAQGAGWAQNRGQAAEAELHPAVGALGIGEHTGLKHHQADVCGGQVLDVLRESGAGLMLNSAVMLQQCQGRTNVSQQQQFQLRVIVHQLQQGWRQLLPPALEMGAAATGHHQAQGWCCRRPRRAPGLAQQWGRCPVGQQCNRLLLMAGGADGVPALSQCCGAHDHAIAAEHQAAHQRLIQLKPAVQGGAQPSGVVIQRWRTVAGVKQQIIDVVEAGDAPLPDGLDPVEAVRADLQPAKDYGLRPVEAGVLVGCGQVAVPQHAALPAQLIEL